MSGIPTKNIGFMFFILFILLYHVGHTQSFRKPLLPTMGWEPWSISHCKVDQDRDWGESYYMKLIDYMDSTGFTKAGYQYLIIECHDHHRDSLGHWTVNREIFPNGYEPVINYAHSKGMKIKVYTDAGKGKCCCNDRGSFGYYEQDAKYISKMGFDGIKIDWCGGEREKLDPRTQYIDFFKAFETCVHKEFDIEICCWGKGNPWEWGRFAGSSWRTSLDIDNQHKPIFVNYPGGKWEILLRNLDANRHPDTTLVGPGKGYNYADMLLVGHPQGLNETEERSQFSLWCMMASPLYISSDIFSMPDYAKEILLDSEVIAINQDPLGLQGKVVAESDDGILQVWAKPLADESIAVALLNRGEQQKKITVEWRDVNIKGKSTVRDVWEKKDLGRFQKKYTALVFPHETKLLKIKPNVSR